MEELIDKMISLLKEYKDKCCDSCKPNKYEIIYKRYNHATLEPFTDYRGCSLGIYRIVKDNNWFGVNGEGYCAAIPSWGGITILRCKQYYNAESKEYEWRNDILFHFTKDDLIKFRPDL